MAKRYWYAVWYAAGRQTESDYDVLFRYDSKEVRDKSVRLYIEAQGVRNTQLMRIYRDDISERFTLADFDNGNTVPGSNGDGIYTRAHNKAMRGGGD